MGTLEELQALKENRDQSITNIDAEISKQSAVVRNARTRFNALKALRARKILDGLPDAINVASGGALPEVVIADRLDAIIEDFREME